MRSLLLRFLSFAVLACPAFPASGAPMTPPNLFSTVLHKSDAEISAKLDAAFAQLFYGRDADQRLYYPVPASATDADTAYIADTGNGDVRSEGMSYGLMLAVQTDHRAEFDRLWRWAVRHMRHATGPRHGYFAWQCAFDGRQLDPGSASDGEEWIVTALFFAAHRWQGAASRPGEPSASSIDYAAEAQSLLRALLHQPATVDVTPIFDRTRRQVVFAPTPEGSTFTDPSYHLPAYYELWSRWAADPADRAFWSAAAQESRAFFHRAAHPITGLMPEYANFDGTPRSGDHGDFRFDAWRTLANVALDYAWFARERWPREQSHRVLAFLRSQGPSFPNQYTLDGHPLSTDHSLGLVAMAAVAGLATDAATAKPFLEELWNAPIPTGQWRYYDGLLYHLALLQCSGRFRPY